MAAKMQILKTLADGRFHSGERLAEQASLSRTAIWKKIRDLRDETGLDIASVRGRGYRLSEPLQLLQKNLVLETLSPPARERLAELNILETVDSTNTWLMRRRAEPITGALACLAEHQTAGRGRRGRAWVSPFGSNLYLSVLWRFPQGPAALSGFSLAAGLAVAEGLEAADIQGVRLKWPNDLQYAGRKLGGLLIEIHGEQAGPTTVVIGLGLNIRVSERYAAQIDQPWIDLQRIVGPAVAGRRNRLAGHILDRLLGACGDFQAQGFRPRIQGWLRKDAHYEKPIAIHLCDQVVHGIHRGVDADGALLLETDQGIRAFHGGEVSLRN